MTSKTIRLANIETDDWHSGRYSGFLHIRTIGKSTLNIALAAAVFSSILAFSAQYSGAAEYVRTYQVSVSADDGYARGATTQDTSWLLMIGDGNVSSPYHISAMRFTNVNIPRSASVTSAILKIQSVSQSLSGAVYGQIRSEASDDAVDFSSRYIASASLNSATVNWDHTSAWETCGRSSGAFRGYPKL